MLKSKRKSNGDYSVNYNGVEYVIYKDSDGWVAEKDNKAVAESNTKSDLLDRLYDVIIFGNV